MAGKENENNKLKVMTVTDWENILVQEITSKSVFFTSIRNLRMNYSVRKLVASIKNNDCLHSQLQTIFINYIFFCITALNKIFKTAVR